MSKEIFRRIITLSLFILSAVFIVIGLTKNQQTDVLTKAVKICLECVGIG